MTVHENQFGKWYDPDPAVVDGTYGYRDEAGVFKSNNELRSLARTVLARRPDGRSARDVLREVLTEEQAIDLLVDEVFQPEDVAAWAFDTDSGRWESES